MQFYTANWKLRTVISHLQLLRHPNKVSKTYGIEKQSAAVTQSMKAFPFDPIRIQFFTPTNHSSKYMHIKNY